MAHSRDGAVTGQSSSGSQVPLQKRFRSPTRDPPLSLQNIIYSLLARFVRFCSFIRLTNKLERWIFWEVSASHKLFHFDSIIFQMSGCDCLIIKSDAPLFTAFLLKMDNRMAGTKKKRCWCHRFPSRLRIFSGFNPGISNDIFYSTECCMQNKAKMRRIVWYLPPVVH